MPPGLEVIKLEYSLKIKTKQPIIALYFEFENELKFHNLETRYLTGSAEEITVLYRYMHGQSSTKYLEPETALSYSELIPDAFEEFNQKKHCIGA